MPENIFNCKYFCSNYVFKNLFSPFITLKRHVKPNSHQLLKSKHKIKETKEFKSKKNHLLAILMLYGLSIKTFGINFYDCFNGKLKVFSSEFTATLCINL